MSRETLLFDRDAIRTLDQRAIESYAMPGLLLMEHASLGVAAAASRLLDRPPTESTVLVVCGRGNNGGDGYAAARHLHRAGADVRLLPLADPDADSDAGINARIAERLNLPRLASGDLASAAAGADLVIDAMFGTGLDRDVSGEPAHIIALLNEATLAHDMPILAVDVPSGFDCQLGRPLGEAIRAAATVTFVGLKPGFLVEGAGAWTGRVFITAIGAPRRLEEELGKCLTLPRGDISEIEYV